MRHANDKKHQAGDASALAMGLVRGREERQKVPFGKRVKKFELFRHFEYYILALPAMVVFFLFAYLPLCGIVLAFKDYNITGGIFGSPWVEPLFSNFAAYFNGPFFLRTTLNTLIINASNLVFTTIFSVGTAIMIKELFSDRVKKIYQNILFLPTFFSVLLVSRFVNLILNNDMGIINVMLENMGFTKIKFYDIPDIWVPILVFVNIWKGTGYGLIIYLSSIVAIDQCVYEAAEIDGAGKMKQLVKITLPMLKPTIIIMVLLSIGRMFYGDFQMIYAFVGTNNYRLMERLDIIETYLYRSVTNSNNPDYGLASAVSLYQSALGFIMIFGSNFIIKKCNPDYALF